MQAYVSMMRPHNRDIVLLETDQFVLKQSTRQVQMLGDGPHVSRFSSKQL